MYAYPAYTAQPGDLSPELEHLLRWASWVLTLPVMLFSCGPFFGNAWRDVLHRRVSMDLPVALGMLITFVVSSAGTFDPTGVFGHEVYFDSLTMFVFFLLTGRWFELRLRDRTAGSLEALMNRLPESVARQLGDGSFERVPVRRLRTGDVIRVLPGEAFPADGLLIRGDTSVDEALLTGESRPVTRVVGDEVISGSHNLTVPVLVRVERVGDETRFAQIVRLMESASTTRPMLARLADTLAKPFLIGVLVAAGLSCAYWWNSDPERALMVAVAVLVVTCPCALSLATPAAMLSAAGALAQRGVLVRRLDALESLAGVDTVLFDKTGTLTRDAMVLAGVRVRSGAEASRVLSMAAALASHSLHPASRALVAAQAGQSNGAGWQVMDVIEQAGQGLAGHVAGRDGGAHLLRLGSFAYCGAAPEASEGLLVCLSDAQGWLATFELQEDIRPDAEATVTALREQGIAVLRRSEWGQMLDARVAEALALPEGVPGIPPVAELDKNVRPVVWLGDSMGEMALYYSLSDVALLGGSFEPLGGQNLIEAAACGCPVVTGPHTFNFADAAAAAVEMGAALRVDGMQAAVSDAVALLAQPHMHAKAVAAAHEFAGSRQGAAAVTAKAVQRLLSVSGSAMR